MIKNISITTVFVKDVDESKSFYTDVLGFEEKDDVVMGDYRWCTVVHPNQPELMVHLNIPGPPFSPEMVEAINRSLDGGGMNGLGLSVDDRYQGQGIGPALLSNLECRAAAIEYLRSLVSV